MNFSANSIEWLNVMQCEGANNDIELVSCEIDVFDCASVIFDLGLISCCLGAFEHFLGKTIIAAKERKKNEILDAHHLFRALNGKIEGYGISLPQLETEANESGTLIRTDFEQLAPGNFRSPQLGRQTSLGGCRQTIRPVTA